MRFKRFSRKAHRYLGLLIGIQFLFWTIGGLYFSWTKIEAIRGNTLKKSIPYFSKDIQIPNINMLVDSLNKLGIIDSIKDIHLSQVNSQPSLIISYFTNKHGVVAENKLLLDLKTKKTRLGISQDLAAEIAQNSMLNPAPIKNIQLLSSTDVDKHHEYRSGVFPAWAVKMESEDNLTIYVDAQSGEVISYRTKQWRIFDFLWMMHTMDYAGRDNLNNWLLRSFGVLGFITLFSGFFLYFNTGRRFWKKD